MDIKDLENRFRFHAATTEEKKNAHTSVRLNCLDLAKFILAKVPAGREQALAITHLEEVMFWANAGIARSKDDTHQFKSQTENSQFCICGEGWNTPVHQ